MCIAFYDLIAGLAISTFHLPCIPDDFEKNVSQENWKKSVLSIIYL
jgi:hypothetical protein